MYAVCSLPNIYNWFLNGFNFSLLEEWTQLVWIVGIFVQSILFCFADSRLLEEKKRLEFSPEDSSSFINKLLFWWLNELPKRGTKKDLEVDDLFELNLDQQSKILFPLWEHYWKPTIKSFFFSFNI